MYSSSFVLEKCMQTKTNTASLGGLLRVKSGWGTWLAKGLEEVAVTEWGWLPEALLGRQTLRDTRLWTFTGLPRVGTG